MKVYFRTLSGWRNSLIDNSKTFKQERINYCKEHFGPEDYKSWILFMTFDNDLIIYPDGIRFIREEDATAFLLRFK